MDLNDLAISNFRKYLQIPSVQPNVDYSECVKFLETTAKDLDLPVDVVYVRPKKPVVIITWKGKKPQLPSILLNSHMDVVPVHEEHWTYKPFAAEIHDGKIYARGSQDMKCVGIQYLEAIRRLRLNGVVCLRSIHVCFVPDEEIGGKEGMKLFVRSEEFKKLNVGMALDESYAHKKDSLIVFYGEKSCWQFTIHCKGQSGHGSLLLENTPGEKVAYILNKAYEFRKAQKKLITTEPTYVGEHVVGLNCTRISGGIQNNVVPCEMSITFDCRISPSNNLDEFEKMINQWCKEAGPGCTLEYHQKDGVSDLTKLDNSNIFWKAFKKASDELGLHLKTEICVGTTDSRYLREIGIPALGFSPMNNTPLLLHAHDEYLGIDTFLRGIEIQCKIISELANVEQ